MTRETVLDLGLCGICVAVVACMLALGTVLRARPIAHEAAGPALLQAFDAGWRPAPPPARPVARHSCATCRDCCVKCNEKDQCCCWHSDKCGCPPKNPTREAAR